MTKTIRLLISIVGISLMSTPLFADQKIRCESHDHQYKMCRADTHGYVNLVKQHSRSDCIQGRTWDYDRRGIWVDNNCKADFVIETRHHTSGHSEHKGENAVAAAAAVALIAAVAASSSNNKHEDRYHDENYHRGGHASFLPYCIIGEFAGYNMQYGTEVKLDIQENGRATANV